MKSRINLGKYSSFGKYSKNVFKTSLITSVPEIATSKSFTKRLIKFLVLIICIIGFIYQTFDFLKIYFSYATVVNVRTTNSFEVEQPALTFCNHNRRKRTVVCARQHRDCIYSLPFVFCSLYPGYCPNKTIDFPYMADYLSVMNESKFNWERSAEEAHNENMIGGCIKEVEGKKHNCELPYKRVPIVTNTGEPNFCYTIESQWGNPDAKPNIYPNSFGFEVDIRLQPEEYIYYYETSTVRIAVHDRKTVTNPYTDGYVLKGGVLYNAYVSLTTQDRLPYPYDTNCTDYLKLWRENNGTGPINDLMCIEQCKLNKLLELGLCIDKNVNYPHTEQLCPKYHISMTSDIIEDCVKQCPSPCRDQKYEVRYEEIDTYDHKCDGNRWCRVERAEVKIIFNKFLLTEYIYEPKYQSVELFSYVGGYMGMWLGLSLVSLFDLFETFLYLLFYPIGRIARTRAHKNRKMTFDPYEHRKNVTVY